MPFFQIRLENFIQLGDLKLDQKVLNTLEVMYFKDEVIEVQRKKLVLDQGYEKQVLEIEEKRERNSYHLKTLQEKLDFVLPRGKTQIITNIPELVQQIQYLTNASIIPLGESMSEKQIGEYSEQNYVFIAINDGSTLDPTDPKKPEKKPEDTKKSKEKDKKADPVPPVKEDKGEDPEPGEIESGDDTGDETDPSAADNAPSLDITKLSDEQKAKLEEFLNKTQ